MLHISCAIMPSARHAIVTETRSEFYAGTLPGLMVPVLVLFGWLIADWVWFTNPEPGALPPGCLLKGSPPTGGMALFPRSSAKN